MVVVLHDVELSIKITNQTSISAICPAWRLFPLPLSPKFSLCLWMANVPFYLTWNLCKHFHNHKGSQKTPPSHSYLLWRSSTQTFWYQYQTYILSYQLWQSKYCCGCYQNTLHHHLSIYFHTSNLEISQKLWVKRLWWSKKSPYSERSTSKHVLTLLWHTSIGLWRTGRGLFGQMRPKLII